MNSTNFLEANSAAVCQNLSNYMTRYLRNKNPSASLANLNFSYDAKSKTLTGCYHFGEPSRAHVVTYASKDASTKKEFLDRFNLDLAAHYIFECQPQAAYKYYFPVHTVDKIEIDIAMGDHLVTTETTNRDQIQKIYDFATGKLNVSQVEFLIEKKLWEKLNMEPHVKPDNFLQLPFVQFSNLA